MIRWLESGGGPLILLARELLAAWQGVAGTSVMGGPSTDYDRACGIQEQIGAITVGSGAGIVLADEPLPTAWVADVPGAAGALVRWEYADNDGDVQKAIDSLRGLPRLEGQVTFEVTGPLVLFDSAYPGTESPSRLEIESLRPGRYSIMTERVQPTRRASFYVYRFF